MKYTLHDNTAYGIYNGFRESDIYSMLKPEVERLGLTVIDYSIEQITRKLNHDPELETVAQAHYTPYPIQNYWGSDYKARWVKMAEEGTAPGEGDVPNDLVRQKLCAILDDIIETIVLPRKKREAEEQTRRAEIMSHIISITTEERNTYDEGGSTKEYIHRVLMPSGKTYTFLDRNVFDFGRIVSYNGAMLSRIDGVLGWNRFIDGDGWNFEQTNEDDEIVLAYRAATLYGFANSSIRM